MLALKLRWYGRFVPRLGKACDASVRAKVGAYRKALWTGEDGW